MYRRTMLKRVENTERLNVPKPKRTFEAEKGQQFNNNAPAFEAKRTFQYKRPKSESQQRLGAYTGSENHYENYNPVQYLPTDNRNEYQDNIDAEEGGSEDVAAMREDRPCLENLNDFSKSVRNEVSLDTLIRDSMTNGVVNLLTLGNLIDDYEKNGNVLQDDLQEHVAAKFAKTIKGSIVGIVDTDCVVMDLYYIAKGQAFMTFVDAAARKSMDRKINALLSDSKTVAEGLCIDLNKTLPLPARNYELGEFNISLAQIRSWNVPKKSGSRQLYYFLLHVLQLGYTSTVLKDLTYRQGLNGGARGDHLTTMKPDVVDYLKELSWSVFGFDDESLELNEEDASFYHTNLFKSIDGSVEQKVGKIKELRRIRNSWDAKEFVQTLKKALTEARRVAASKEMERASRHASNERDDSQDYLDVVN